MARPLTFRWVKRPSALNKRIEEEFGEGGRIYVALHAMAAHWGASVQNAARAGVKWQDRTGNARGGLFFAVDGFGLNPLVGEVKPEALAQKTDTTTISGDAHRLVIALGHTVFYGRFLELNSRYGIVMSTLESNLGRLEGMLRGLLR